MLAQGAQSVRQLTPKIVENHDCAVTFSSFVFSRPCFVVVVVVVVVAVAAVAVVVVLFLPVSVCARCTSIWYVARAEEDEVEKGGTKNSNTKQAGR